MNISLPANTSYIQSAQYPAQTNLPASSTESPDASAQRLSVDSEFPATDKQASEKSENQSFIATEADQRAIIAELSQRDREVRAHEQAHAAAGGIHAGAPSLDYQRGPNGRYYASAGEVSIDLSAVPGDAQATLEKALIVQRAAMAPADPSTTDQRVAASATAMAAQARTEIASQLGEKPEDVSAARQKDEHGQQPQEINSDASRELAQQLVTRGAIESQPTKGVLLDLSV